MTSENTVRWLSLRVRMIIIAIFFVGSLLPPYVPKAALAPEEVAVATPQFLLVEDGFIMKSASITQKGSRRAYAEGIIHTVEEGESIGSLAERYGIRSDTIRWSNKLSETASIQPGDTILILPVDGVLHTVSRGQSLMKIAELYSIPIEKIAEQNSIQKGFILAGQELIIPGGVPIVQPTVVAVVEPEPAAPAEPTPEPGPEPSEPAPKPVREPPAPKPIADTTSEAGFTREPTTGVLQKPCSSKCFVTQYYRGGHYALDMQEKGGGPIFASEAGTVIRADHGWNGGYGNVIEVDHGNGLVTLYAHNKKLHVGVGDQVSRGQLIADMGNTGLVYGATGIHVHFEVRLRGVKKNPWLYIQ